MEWDEPAIVLPARAFGEGDAVVSVWTRDQGRHLGLARGGGSRRQAALWQPGNLVQVRWVGRLADQLGSFTGEPIRATAALVMDAAPALALLTAACAVADGALPERAPHPRAFAGMLRLIAALGDPLAAVRDLVAWETALLADLGYGLDLSHCAVSGAPAASSNDDLAYVSPRTGRAVTRSAAGSWVDRLLALPRFMIDPAAPATADDLADGLRLTGHFLARDAFGTQHRPLPAPRLALYDRLRHKRSAESRHEDAPDA